MEPETKKDTRYANQRLRQLNYPKDRICFLSNATAAKNDVTIFNKYINYEISKGQAMKEIASNNYLSEITEEQFITELILLGYYIPRKGKDN